MGVASGCDDSDPVADGKALVARLGCPTCHQPAVASDGTLAGQTTPQPGSQAYGANLTPDRTAGLGGWADVEIVRAVRFGVDNEQQPLCPPMPRFDGSDPAHPYLSDDDGVNLVAYLRSLPPVARAVPGSECGAKGPPPADMAVSQ